MVNRINIAVCDDEEVELKLLEKLIGRWSKETGINCSFNSYTSAEAFLFDYEENQNTDILILDIQMKEMNGMELAKRLYGEGKKIEYIFITGIKQYVFDGYSVEAVSYLLKPVKAEQLNQSLSLACKRLHKQPSLILEDGNNRLKILLQDIAYLESAGHSTYFYIKGTEYKSSRGISFYEEELAERGFYRLHRSYIVNLARVECITKKTVMVDGVPIPVARGQWENLNKAYLTYHRRSLEGNLT